MNSQFEKLEKDVKDESLEKEEYKKAKRALVMKDIGNLIIVSNGKVDWDSSTQSF